MNNMLSDGVEYKRSRLARYFGSATVSVLSPQDVAILQYLDDFTLHTLHAATAREIEYHVVPLAQQDAAKLNALAHEFGSMLTAYIRKYPRWDIERLASKLDKRQKYQEQLVPGLFDSIDRNTRLNDWAFQSRPIKYERDGYKVLGTKVAGPGGKMGWFKRAYNPNTGTLKDLEAFLFGLPTWIKAGIPLVPGKGTPTVVYTTIYQMKLLGIGYGSLREVVLDQIQNIEALCHLHWLQRQHRRLSLDVLAMETESLPYMETVITQSGHRIVNWRLISGQRVQIAQLLTHYEHHAFRRVLALAPRSYLRAILAWWEEFKEHGRILARYGLRRNTEVICNYNINLDVRTL